MLTCIKGNGGERTKIAIEKYRAIEALDDRNISMDGYFKIINETWKQKQRLGCPKCGTAKRFGIGLCRRCYHLQSALRQLGTVTPQSFIAGIQSEFAAFARTLADRPLTRAAKLNALLTWKPENSQS